MADSNGMALLALLRSSLTSLLSDALDELRQSAGLPALGPARPEWAGCGFEDHLLAPIVDGGDAANPVTAQVISALRKLSQVAGPQGTAGLFGWDPDPVAHAADRGIACAVRINAAGGGFAAAIAVTMDAGAPRIDIVAKGDVAKSEPLALDEAWSLVAGGHASDVIEIRLPETGSATVTRGANGDTIDLGLSRKGSRSGSEPGIDLGDTATPFDWTYTRDGVNDFLHRLDDQPAA